MNQSESLLSEQKQRASYETLAKRCRKVRFACLLLGLVTIFPHVASVFVDDISVLPFALSASDGGADFVPESLIGEVGSAEVIVIDEGESLGWLPEIVLGPVAFIPTLIFLVLLYQIEGIFSSYERLIFFTEKNNQQLKRVGVCLIVLVLAEPLISVLEYGVVTPRLAEHASELDVPPLLLVHIDFPMLIVGVVLYLMARVLNEALLLQKEVDSTV